MAGLGVVLVYSATRSKLAAAGLNPHYFLTRQAAYVVVGGIVMIVLATLDYRWLEHASAVLYVAMILALLAMFTGIGSSAMGATRWVQIGGVQIQPSAFATLVLIVTVATFCARRPEGLGRNDILKVLALAAVPILLVVKQPDLGSGIVMCRGAARDARHRRHPQPLPVAARASHRDRGLRRGALQAPEGLPADPDHRRVPRGQEPAEHGVQRGPVGGGHRLGGLVGDRALPRARRPTWPMCPSSRPTSSSRRWASSSASWARPGVLALLGVLSWRLLRSAQLARDAFGRLLAAGCFTLVAFSVFENAGMAMGIMPVAGIPLPFLSYGGSATVAFFSAIGIALSVQLRAQR